MIVLALDTCLGACSVAIYDRTVDRVLASRFEKMDKGHAEALAPMVEACLKEAKLIPSAITRIAVTKGPGTFTGLRVGLSLAHGMATALECEIVGINSLQATAAPIFATQEKVIVIHRAGATGKFYAGVVSAETGDEAVHFATAEEVQGLMRPDISWLGTGAYTFAPRVAGHDLPSAEDFVRFAANLKATHILPQPLYLREPDAKPSTAKPATMIRKAQDADLATLARLHGLSFNAGWNAESFASALMLPGGAALVLVRDGEVRSFVQYQIAADKAEINTICTEPHWRGRGFARQLLTAAMADLKSKNVTRLHLEVAMDNAAAVRLYETQGFAVVGRRKQYYARENSAAVDALLMSKALA